MSQTRQREESRKKLLDDLSAQDLHIKELKTSLDRLHSWYETRPFHRLARPWGVSSKDKPNLNIQFYNASKCDNLGDDYISDVATEYLRMKFPGASVTVHQRVTQKMAEADVVILGPGGILYDFDDKNVLNYHAIVGHANHLGKTILFMGVGTQGVRKAEGKKRLREILGHSGLVTVRDNFDKNELLQKQLVTPDKVITSCDTAFLNGFIELQRKWPILRRPRALISLADWQLPAKEYQAIQHGLEKDIKAYKDYALKNIKQLSEVYDVTILAQAREDREFASQLARELNGPVTIYRGGKNYKQVLQLFRDTDLVITSRYHGYILGLLHGARCIAVTYPGHKIHRLVDELLPSQKKGTYLVSDFVEKDVFEILIKTPPVYLRCPNFLERCKIAVLARKNEKTVKFIKNYFKL